MTKTTTIQMEELSCPSCVKKIEAAISKQSGVEEVQVLFHSQKVKVTFHEQSNQPEDFVQLLEKLGYPVLGYKVS